MSAIATTCQPCDERVSQRYVQVMARDERTGIEACPACVCSSPSERSRETPGGLGSPSIDPRAEQRSTGTAVDVEADADVATDGGERR